MTESACPFCGVRLVQAFSVVALATLAAACSVKATPDPPRQIVATPDTVATASATPTASAPVQAVIDAAAPQDQQGHPDRMAAPMYGMAPPPRRPNH